MPLLLLEDRQLFCRMVFKLNGNPISCLLMIGLWRWIEEDHEYIDFHSRTIIPRLLRAEDHELVTVMNEATRVLDYFNHPHIMIIPDLLPQTQRMMNRSQFYALLFTVRSTLMTPTTAARHICETIDDMLHRSNLNMRLATDMNWFMRQMQPPEINDNNNSNPMQVVQAGVQSYPTVLMYEDNTYRIPLGNRTLFITIPGFPGNPITLQELKSYFTSRCGGKCIELIRMGRPLHTDGSPWYAHVVFISARTTRMILGDDLRQSNLILEDNVRWFVAGTF